MRADANSVEAERGSISERREGTTVNYITYYNTTKVVNNADNVKMMNTGNQGRTPVIEGATDERVERLEAENARLQ